jgi:hypothetical protein
MQVAWIASVRVGRAFSSPAAEFMSGGLALRVIGGVFVKVDVVLLFEPVAPPAVILPFSCGSGAAHA